MPFPVLDAAAGAALRGGLTPIPVLGPEAAPLEGLESPARWAAYAVGGLSGGMGGAMDSVMVGLAFAPALDTLSDGVSRRMARQQQSLGVRLLARQMLARCLPAVPLTAWTIAGGGDQPLQLHGPVALHLSVAHSHGWLACAISPVSAGSAVGVDVEREPAAGMDDAAVWDVYLHPAEQQAMLQWPAAERPAQALQRWCRKEAWLKASGQAHTIGMAELVVQDDGMVLPHGQSAQAAVALAPVRCTAAWRLDAPAALLTLAW